MGRRRSSSSVTNLTDDIKDFIDDELVERGRDTERDLRRAGRNWVDSDDDDDDDRGRGRRGSRRDRDDEIDELRDAIKALTAKVSALADSSSNDKK
jgi:hypothetical protein